MCDIGLSNEPSQFNINNTNLTNEQKQQLTQFLNENRDVFARNMQELGTVKGLQCSPNF